MANNSPRFSHLVPRRTALRYGAVAAGATAAVASGVGIAHTVQTRHSPLDVYNQSTGSTLPFLHGVASGDPLPNSVVLWTRVTPNRDALPGSGLGEALTVTWEIATDAAFSSIVGTGTVTATAASDHTIHVDPMNLAPATVYYYRFRVENGEHAGAYSPVGRTLTAPAADATPEALNFAVASCANWESGFFNSYDDMAKKAHAGEIDFVAFLGDYIYEYGTGEYVGKKGPVRAHHPSWEIVALEDYRIRYGRYRTDANLQAAHAAAPWVVIWDDHESANNAWREGAENHTDSVAEGQWAWRYGNALQAYYEWMPIRQKAPSEQGHLYRSIRFGTLMELTLMDLRSYRDAETTSDKYGDPNRSMLGSEQFQWLEGVISSNDTTWMVLGNSVMVAPMRIMTIPGDDAANAGLTAIKGSTSGFAMNSDQWDGYSANRDQLLAMLEARGKKNFFITGDIHSEWANDIFRGDQRVACELVTTSISAPNVDQILTQYTGIPHQENNSTSVLIENSLRSANPWVHHLDFDAHGYAVATVAANDITMRFFRVADVEAQQSEVSLALTKVWNPEAGFTQ